MPITTMTVEKLDTFVIKDKYNLTELELFEEAQASAQRRAEIMRWTNVSAVRTVDPTYQQDEFTCHTYDLTGINLSSKSETEEEQDIILPKPSSGIAARELNS